MTSPSFIESSHPEFLAEQREALEAQLLAAAREIDGYRQTLKPVPSDRSWVREWPGLGSAKTWSKVLGGDFEEMSVEAQLPNYRAVASALAAQKKSRAEEELYDDLAGAQALTLAVLRLMHHYGKDRLILAKGGNGTGKSSALAVIRAGVASGSMHIVEANDTWKSEREAFQDILTELGYTPAELAKLGTNGDRLQALLAVLKRKGRIILAIDEAHHCTGRILNLVKTLINRTEVLVVMAGMDTLLQKLRAAASEEAKQLFQNRMFQSVSLAGPDAAGAGEFFRRRLGVTTTWKAATLKTIAETSVHCGAWSFVRRMVDHLGNSGTTHPDDADLLAAAESAAKEIA